MSSSTQYTIRTVKAITDYQFSKNVTDVLFNKTNNVKIEYSRNTGRIKHVFVNEQLILSYRPNVGLFTLNLISASRIVENIDPLTLRLVVLDEVSEFIRKGRSVFNKHVLKVDQNLRPFDEVIVVNEKDEILGIGRLMLPIPYVKSFKTGIAVKIRKGVDKSKL